MANIKQAILSTLFGSGETTTVYHYILHFKTLDGVEHECNDLRYIDIHAINCPPVEYYICNKDFLHDNKGAYYPMSAITKLWFEEDAKIENVHKTEYAVWYEA